MSYNWETTGLEELMSSTTGTLINYLGFWRSVAVSRYRPTPLHCCRCMRDKVYSLIQEFSVFLPKCKSNSALNKSSFLCLKAMSWSLANCFCQY